MAPGKARDAGNGRSLAKSRNAAWRHFPRNLSGRAPARRRTKRQQTLDLAHDNRIHLRRGNENRTIRDDRSER
jgi:hypothetical protein